MWLYHRLKQGRDNGDMHFIMFLIKTPAPTTCPVLTSPDQQPLCVKPAASGLLSGYNMVEIIDYLEILEPVIT